MRLLQATRRISFATLLLTLPACAAVNVPDWVRQAAAQKLPIYAADTNAVVLLEDKTFTVNGPNGDVTEHDRRVVKIFRPDGRHEALLGVSFRKDEKLNSIHAWSIDSSGHEFEVKDKDFAEISSYRESLYDDLRARVAQAPAADPGTIVAFDYEVQRHDFLDELHWWIQEDIPVLQSTLTLQLPSSYEYKDLWANTDPVRAASIGPNRWQWTKSNLPAIEKEEGRPA